MESIVAIKEILELLGDESIWVFILLAALVIRCLCPYQLTHKIEETKDKKTGKKTYKVFRLYDE